MFLEFQSDNVVLHQMMLDNEHGFGLDVGGLAQGWLSFDSGKLNQGAVLRG
jgi:hypothetical protein